MYEEYPTTSVAGDNISWTRACGLGATGALALLLPLLQISLAMKERVGQN